MALRNNKINLELFENIKNEISSKESEKKEKAQTLMDSIKKVNILFIKEADDKDQLYGAVSKKEIINFFNEKNIKLISDDLKINQPIRTLGEHTIEFNPYEGIVTELKIVVNKT